MSRSAAAPLAVASITAVVALAAAPAAAQHPLRHPVDAVEVRYAMAHPVVHYTLRVDAADLSGWTVEMRVRNAPDTLRLATAAHPEYDDRPWRFVEALTVEGPRGAVAAVREDSALWRAVVPGGEAVVRWRVRLPAADAANRAAWRPFLTATGGLTGGPHAFLYLRDATLAPSHVTLALPAGWDVATGLAPTVDPRTFFAPSVDVLVDSPMFVGQFRRWGFAVDGVPHRVAYWPLPDATPFDTAAFVDGIERLARAAVALFGRAPYRDYTFVFQDGAYGGLEHLNSATLGAPSEQLARDPGMHLLETAHEFIHTWNLMRIRPAERGGVHHVQSGQSRGLWFSEGLTMYYADLLLRRAGLPAEEPTRLAHLESAIARYLANAGNTRISPERASLAEYGAPPGTLGDYDPNVHLQGELLGAMLDLVVRDATGGRRSMDDVMRLMLGRHAGEHGFTGADVERAVTDVCGCAVGPLFERHVRGAGAIPFDDYLRLAGLRARVTWTPVLREDGRPEPDLRVWGWQPTEAPGLHLRLIDPESAWGRAGLHTGDQLVRLNGAPVATWPEMRGVLARLQVGDTVRVEVRRDTGSWTTTVAVTGYDRPTVRLEELPQATARQRALRAAWVAGR